MKEERAADAVEELLRAGVGMVSINLAEALDVLGRVDGVPAERLRGLVERASSTSCASRLHLIVWGASARPFEGERVRLGLIESTPFDSAVTLQRYRPLGVGSK